MPELPEVETIRRELAPKIEGHRFIEVFLLCPQMVRHPSSEEFRRCLLEQTIQELTRRGKYLIFRLQSGKALILHLRMSGALLLKRTPAKVDPYTQAIFHLDNSLQIHFCDRRKLGTMELVADEAEVTSRLGPEPLESDFSPEMLAQRLSQHKAPIKAMLLDQKVLAGLGNMYADEALFSAHIHPLREANSLKKEEAEQLHRAIVEVLTSAIDNKGASVDTYLRPGGEPGNQQFYFRVAHRRNEPCPICGTAIQRVPIRNRGSYFCPHCQKE
jgi:formamidopyrimidine-DNA glycosylase